MTFYSPAQDRQVKDILDEVTERQLDMGSLLILRDYVVGWKSIAEEWDQPLPSEDTVVRACWQCAIALAYSDPNFGVQWCSAQCWHKWCWSCDLDEPQ